MTNDIGMPTPHVIAHQVDDEDTICFSNRDYDEFAVTNSSLNVASAAVLNRSLWDFIVDVPTRELYREILKRVRDGSLIRIDFRCDSPTWRRLMQMEIASGDNQTVEFRVRTKEQTGRPYQSLLDNEAARSDEFLERAVGSNRSKFPITGWRGRQPS